MEFHHHSPATFRSKFVWNQDLGLNCGLNEVFSITSVASGANELNVDEVNIDASLTIISSESVDGSTIKDSISKTSVFLGSSEPVTSFIICLATGKSSICKSIGPGCELQ